MSVYLHDIPLTEAKAVWEQVIGQMPIVAETIPLTEHAVGRVLVEPVWAKISAPHYHASAMDGFAVIASATNGALLTAPKTLLMGEQASYVDTGDPLPAWANAVIPIENIEPLDETGALSADNRQPHAIRIRAAMPPWKHVRPMGEDMVATQLVLPAGHTLRPVDLGAIAGSGHHEITVSRKPRVAILPTGTELKAIGEPVGAGDIIEYNSLVLAGQVRQWGGEATRFPITPDNFADIQATVAQAAQNHDLILLNAGSSAGSEDFSADVIASLGEVYVHGVAVRPGHPVILGTINPKSKIQNPKSKIPIIGVPGYPVSAALTAEVFVEPVLARWLGRAGWMPEEMPAFLTRKTPSPSGDDDYVRVVVGKVGDKTLAAPLTRGAGVISSLVRADGIVIFPSGSQGMPAGAEVNVRLYRSRRDIAHTIFAIGSHDLTLDLLAQFLAGQDRRLASANVGSLGGLIALKRGEAHFAGAHLLDPETGDYNLSYIRKYLPNTPVTVMAWVGREQGLLVPKGNSKAIKALADLTRDDVHFANRQRGAGTRVLLDYELGKLGVDEPQQHISGYDQEEYTHLAVAAAVASGRADCGLGITAAAHALDLDFLPLFQEQYQLVIPTQFFQDPLLDSFHEVVRSTAFRRSLAKLAGYDVSQLGQIVHTVE